MKEAERTARNESEKQANTSRFTWKMVFNFKGPCTLTVTSANFD
jgi:hypothetical protein